MNTSTVVWVKTSSHSPRSHIGLRDQIVDRENCSPEASKCDKIREKSKMKHVGMRVAQAAKG